MPLNILCVDDQIDTVEAIKILLQLEGYGVTTAMTAKDAMLLLENNQYHAVILDTGLPDTSGLDLCRWIRADSADVPIIIYSGNSGKSDIDKARAAGAARYLVKPADFDDIVGAIQDVIKQQVTTDPKQ